MARPDVIFHLAGDSRAARDLDMVWPTLRNNLLTTVNLLSLAAEFGCRRFVLAGSLEEPQETGEVCPSSPYAASKLASGSYARMFHRLYQVPVVIGRIFMTYGPRQYDRNKLIPYSILSFLKGEAPKLSSGLRKIDWIFVEDVVDGLLAAATAHEIEGATVDLGSGVLVTIRETVEQVAQILGTPVQPAFGVLPDRPIEQVRTADVAFSFRKLGWHARTSIGSGLAQTIAWYRNQLPG